MLLAVVIARASHGHVLLAGKIVVQFAIGIAPDIITIDACIVWNISCKRMVFMHVQIYCT